MGRIAAILAVLISLALVPSVAAASTAGAAAKRCGEVSVGYTNANVSGERVRCYFARVLVRRWVRTVNRRDCNEANNYCQVVRVRSWRCVRGGGEGIVRLRCSAGSKRVRAAWGD